VQNQRNCKEPAQCSHMDYSFHCHLHCLREVLSMCYRWTMNWTSETKYWALQSLEPQRKEVFSPWFYISDSFPGSTIHF
jgi:hypothetical protein